MFLNVYVMESFKHFLITAKKSGNLMYILLLNFSTYQRASALFHQYSLLLSFHTLTEIQEKLCIQLEIGMVFNHLIRNVLVMLIIQLFLASCKVTDV